VSVSRLRPATLGLAIFAGLVIAAAGVAGTGCREKARRQAGTAAAVEVVTMPPLPDGGQGGAPTGEIEPNDGDDVATLLPLGGAVRGVVDADGDADHYRIDVAEAGALSVMVEGRETLDAELLLADASGTVIATSERGAARVREGIPNFGVTPGRYTAVVRAKKPPPPKPAPRGRAARKAPEPPRPSTGPYEITARMVAPVAGGEREPDNDRGEANDLIAGDTASGYIGWAGDVDVWKISVEALSAKNALDIELSAVEGVALSIEILDGIGKPLVARKAARGAPLVVRGFAPVVPQGAPPFHYLAVKADRSNPETTYQLRAIAKLIVPDGEVEPNDTPETAMAVPADRRSVQARWSTGDVDCFAIAPEDAAHNLEVSIDTPGELDLAIDARVDGQLVAQVDQPGKGAAEKLTTPLTAGARAVVCVRGGKELAGDQGYQLVIDEGAASP
jgi:hypothetical protein